MSDKSELVTKCKSVLTQCQHQFTKAANDLEAWRAEGDRWFEAFEIADHAVKEAEEKLAAAEALPEDYIH